MHFYPLTEKLFSRMTQENWCANLLKEPGLNAAEQAISFPPIHRIIPLLEILAVSIPNPHRNLATPATSDYPSPAQHESFEAPYTRTPVNLRSALFQFASIFSHPCWVSGKRLEVILPER